jgi:hypothetical protein
MKKSRRTRFNARDFLDNWTVRVFSLKLQISRYRDEGISGMCRLQFLSAAGFLVDRVLRSVSQDGKRVCRQRFVDLLLSGCFLFFPL